MTYEEYLNKQNNANGAGDTSLAANTEESNKDAELKPESSTVTQTQNYLQQLLQNKPSDFNSKYLPQLETLYDKVMNRDKFSYDVQGDPLYQQYKNQYAQMGKLAMQDAIGNASALTGGYGNSWAATAGNQAYQGYLQQLNAKVPELYESAYNRYAQEGEDLQNQLAITSSLYDNEYGKYMDDLNYMQQVQQLNTSQQAAAFEKLINMMQLGMTPSEELIAMAGITADDVAAYQKKLSGGGGAVYPPITDTTKSALMNAAGLVKTGLNNAFNGMQAGMKAAGQQTPDAKEPTDEEILAAVEEEPDTFRPWYERMFNK